MTSSAVPAMRQRKATVAITPCRRSWRKQFGGWPKFPRYLHLVEDAYRCWRPPQRRHATNIRAPGVPGFGIKGDYSLASFDIRNVFHFSGSYDLPFGKGKKFGSNASVSFTNAIVRWLECEHHYYSGRTANRSHSGVPMMRQPARDATPSVSKAKIPSSDLIPMPTDGQAGSVIPLHSLNLASWA